MISFFYNILNVSNRDKDTPIIKASATEVETEVVDQIESQDKENVSIEIPKKTGTVDLNRCQVQLTNCMNESNQPLSQEISNSSKINLSDGKRPQRKCAKRASKKISRISKKLLQPDNIYPRSSAYSKARSKRTCAKIAKVKIAELAETSSESDDTEVDESE